jgi:hypothetical protein
MVLRALRTRCDAEPYPPTRTDAIIATSAPQRLSRRKQLRAGRARLNARDQIVAGAQHPTRGVRRSLAQADV